MQVKTTNDSSFLGHFKSNAKTGVRVFKRSPLIHKLWMVPVFLIAPFVWAGVALGRHRRGEKVMVVIG